MKRKKLSALMCVLFIMLSGCTSVLSGSSNDTENPNGNSADSGINSSFGNEKPSGKHISQGRLPNYLTMNNLTITDPYENDDSKNSIVISGLKNEKIQASINKTIESSFQKLNAMSTAAIMGNDSDIIKKDISYDSTYVTEIGNNNNIFSVHLSRSFEYDFSDASSSDSSDEAMNDYPQYFSEDIYLNFDLNTGKQLNLADVFADGFNYADFINTKIFEKLDFDGPDNGTYYYGDDTLFPRGSFAGLTEEPSFLISENGLQLFFDKNSPEFINYSGTDHSITIPLADIDDNLAVFDRFNSRGSKIYTDAGTSNKILVSYDEGSHLVLNSAEKDVSIDGTIVHANSTWQYSNDLPDSLIKMIKKDISLDTESIANSISEESLSEENPYYYNNIKATKYGCYLSYNYYNSEDIYILKVFKIDGNEFEEMEPADIFVPDFDWQNKLSDLLIKEYTGVNYDQKYKNIATKEYVLSLFKNEIENFQLSSDSIAFNFKDDDNKDVQIPYYSATYSDIGCNNLTIFHD